LSENELFHRFELWPTISDHFGTIFKNFIVGIRFVVQVQSKKIQSFYTFVRSAQNDQKFSNFFNPMQKASEKLRTPVAFETILCINLPLLSIYNCHGAQNVQQMGTPKKT
jgi:hypothetical protein